MNVTVAFRNFGPGDTPFGLRPILGWRMAFEASEYGARTQLSVSADGVRVRISDGTEFSVPWERLPELFVRGWMLGDIVEVVRVGAIAT